ncbi:hypothetical protein, partial [Alloscardovia macacae]|uniref:hypothetical protein n=1 Tax=Alloscardovia macacae TaxID=1160091 RepID=UPI001C5A7119
VWWCIVFIRCLIRHESLSNGFFLVVCVCLCCGGLRTQERVLYYFLCFDNASDARPVWGTWKSLMSVYFCALNDFLVVFR